MNKIFQIRKTAIEDDRKRNRLLEHNVENPHKSTHIKAMYVLGSK